MKKWFIPFISLIANTYFVLVWILVFNSFETHQERVKDFLRFIPRDFSIGFLTTLLILLSIISIVLIARDRLKPWLKVVFVLIQGVFTCLLLWQLL